VVIKDDTHWINAIGMRHQMIAYAMKAWEKLLVDDESEVSV